MNCSESLDPNVSAEAKASALRLHPELRLASAVVGALDVPVLSLRVVVHRRHEIERRLELDVVEAGFGCEQLVPFAGGDEHETARTHRLAARVVLHLTSALLDEVKVLGRHWARFRRLMHVAW